MTKKDLSKVVLASVISETQHAKNMDIDIWADTMCWVMPDDRYDDYIAARNDPRKFQQEYADKLFKKFARSQI
jgi:hypothetical protein